MSASQRAFRAAPHRLTVGLIGAGRVGPVLAAALAAAGHHVVATTARSTLSQQRVATLLPQVPVLTTSQVARQVPDLLLLAVGDDALAALVQDLAAAEMLRAGQVVAHTSGTHGVDVLQPALAADAQALALHPAMTFTGELADLDRLPGVCFGVTADHKLRTLATRTVADLGGTVEWIDEADRRLYHAALAHGANHLVTLINDAADLLRDAGVTRPAQVLAPLLKAALENTLARGDQALTGPVARGDAGTVTGHLQALAASSTGAVNAYRALARRTADRAITHGLLQPADAETLLDVLANTASAPGAIR